MFSWGELFSTFMARKIMGVEGGCRSGNRGGVPLLCFIFPISGANTHHPPAYPRAIIRAKTHQKGQKQRYICLLLCFLGILRDQKGRKAKIYLKSGAGCKGFGCLLLLVTGAGGQAFWASGPAECWRWSSGAVFPAFWSLCCLAFEVLGLNMPLFRVLRAFSAGFGVLVWVCIVRVLCVDCVAFVRVYS